MNTMKKVWIALLTAVLGCLMLAGCISSKIAVKYMLDENTIYLTQEYDLNDEIQLPTEPTMPGKAFVNWYTDAACTQPYTTGKVTYALTLYAKFSSASVYIVIDPNGGTMESNRVSVVPGEAYTLPEPTKEGYTFIGYTYFDGTQQQEFPTAGTYSGDQSIAITAQYAVNKYEVSFMEGSEAIADAVEVAYGSKVTLPAVSKAGYDLEGWYTDADCTAKFDAATAITAEITLYAKYTPKTFTITVNGAQDGYVNPQVVYGTTYTLTIPELGDGYEFVKFVDKDGKEVAVSGTYTWTTDITVTAKWDTVYGLIYCYDGDKVVAKVIDKMAGTDLATIQFPQVPAKEGYDADADWYTDKACTTKFVAEGELSDDGLNLYAKYTPKTYTVTFNVWTQAGLKTVSVDVKYGEVIEDVPALATREAYDFGGYLYGETTFDVTAPYAYAKDIVVTEKWTLKDNVSMFEYVSQGDDVKGYFKEKENPEDNWTFVLLTNVTNPYSFTNTELSFVNPADSQYATIENGTIMPIKPGTFEVNVVKDNGNIRYVRTMKVVEQVAAFGVGSDYSNAWVNRNTATWKDVWDNETKGDKMTVGRTNFIPELSIQGANGALTLEQANVVVEVTVDGQSTNDWTLNGAAINFGASLANKLVGVKVYPRYVANQTTATIAYELQLNEGVNVYTNEELKANFNNPTISVINVLRNIKAELSEDQTNMLQPDANGNYRNPKGDVYNIGSKAIITPMNGSDKYGGSGVYQRASGNMKLNGNYFTVDGSELPLVDGRDASNFNEEAAYTLQNNHFSIFLFGVRFSSNYDTFEMENLNIVGNNTGVSTTESDYKIYNKPVLIYSGACIGIQIGSGTLNLDNVTSRYVSFALNSYAETPRDLGGGNYTHQIIVNAKDCNFANSWANNMYTAGFVKVTLDDCYIGAANGAAVHFDSIGHPSGVECELNLINNTKIDNWVVGDETWFIVYGADSSVGMIKTSVNDAVMMLSGGQRTVVKDSKVNFAILMKTIGDDWNDGKDDDGQGSLIVNFPVFNVGAVQGGDYTQDTANTYAYTPVPGGLIEGLQYMEVFVEIIKA